MCKVDVEKMLGATFGVEIEFYGMTRYEAAQVVLQVIGGTLNTTKANKAPYYKHLVVAEDGRIWTIMRDASVANGGPQSCELVTPILNYRKDIETLQKVVRGLREAGGKTNDGCGIHIHVGGDGHNARTLKNWINIMARRQNIFVKTLKVLPTRVDSWAQLFTESFISKVNKAKLTNTDQLKVLWYKELVHAEPPAYDDQRHYDHSRYHFLNLHSFFGMSHHTVEIRAFNSELHAGKVRAYVAFVLALNYQALTYSKVISTSVVTNNEKKAMRSYLSIIGLGGEEFKNCREHLLAGLA